jgi:phosphoribosylaminoimidazole (AIR) synthetase
MVVCVSEKDKDSAIQCLKTSGETAWEIGKVETRQDGSELVRFI